MLPQVTGIYLVAQKAPKFVQAMTDMAAFQGKTQIPPRVGTVKWMGVLFAKVWWFGGSHHNSAGCCSTRAVRLSWEAGTPAWSPRCSRTVTVPSETPRETLCQMSLDGHSSPAVWLTARRSPYACRGKIRASKVKVS